MGPCELPVMGAGNCARVLRRSSACALLLSHLPGPYACTMCANKCQLMPVHFTPIFSFDPQNPPACWGDSKAILILPLC